MMYVHARLGLPGPVFVGTCGVPSKHLLRPAAPPRPQRACGGGGARALLHAHLGHVHNLKQPGGAHAPPTTDPPKLHMSFGACVKHDKTPKLNL